jgi:hypothetical protein
MSRRAVGGDDDAALLVMHDQLWRWVACTQHSGGSRPAKICTKTGVFPH